MRSVSRRSFVMMAASGFAVTACSLPAFVVPAPTSIPAAPLAPVPTAMPMDGRVMAPPSAAGQAHAAREATLPPVADGEVKQISIDVLDRTVDIAPGVALTAWTFGGNVPGPFLHVKQGDLVHFTLVNNGSMGHSIDFHAARTAPSISYKTVNAGERFSFDWKAQDPGAFMYHCGTAPALQHMAEGMFGAVIVEPVAQPLPKVDREFVFVQNEYYLAQPQGTGGIDYDKAKSGLADLVVFNGYANQYSDHPIPVKVGEKIRMHVVNVGPNHFSAVHVVGTIFDHVWVDGNPANDLKGIQTWTLAPGEGGSFDFTLSEAGSYPMVTHSFSDVIKGAVAVFKAE